MARPTAGHPAGPQGAAGGDPPQLTLLNLFPTPLVIATMPDAEVLNAELKRIDPRARSRERIRAAFQPRRVAVELGSTPMGRRAGPEVLSLWPRHRRARSPSTAPVSVTSSPGASIPGPTSTGTATATSSTRIPAHSGPPPTTSTTAASAPIPRSAASSRSKTREAWRPIMYAPYLTFPGPDGAALGEAQRLTPRAGMFVVFPSWLSHGVRPYRGTRERISIAINFSLGGG